MLRFVLDEHLRGPLWLAVVRHNSNETMPIDAVRVGDSPDLPLGSDDAAILQWAQEEDRILLTEDVHTMPGHLQDHLQAGRHSPGVFILSTGCSIKAILSHLELVAHAGDSRDYQDTITYMP